VSDITFKFPHEQEMTQLLSKLEINDDLKKAVLKELANERYSWYAIQMKYLALKKVFPNDITIELWENILTHLKVGEDMVRNICSSYKALKI
jgi:hypothetical protein